MEKQKTNGIVIKVICRNEELYRLNTCDFTEEISIGRDTDCTWSVGHADSSVSGRHAIISRRKKDFYLTDLGSRNGMYCNNARVKEVRLAPGMNVQFGECILAVSLPGERNVPKAKPHLLKYINEKGRKVKFLLRPGSTKIGSAEKYDLCLNSTLVSSPHAVITGKTDGSYWIKDLNSRNGTCVNRMDLAAKTERMLKDGDVISIADVEMVYFDPTVKHSDFRLAVAFVTLVITALACIAAYYGWQMLNPPAETLVLSARSAARQADFARARELLVSAASARNSDAVSEQRKLLQNRIAVWEHSAGSLNALKKALAEKQFKAVPQLVGNMDLRSVSAWDWNEQKAVTRKSEIEFVRNTFAAMNRLDGILRNPESDEKQLAAGIAQMKKMQAQFSEYTDPCMGHLKKNGTGIVLYAEKIQKDLAAFSGIITSLENGGMADLAAETAKLEALRKQAPPILAEKLDKVLPLFHAVKNAQKQLAEQEKLLYAMRFTECENLAVAIPETALQVKAIDHRLAGLRQQSEKIREYARHLDIYFNILKKDRIVPGSDCALLTAFLDQKKLAAVFACDSLSLPYPARQREKASGIYDEMVGIEYLYGVLMMIKTYEPVRSRYEISYSPVLEKAANMISVMEHFISYTESNLPALRGELKQYVAHLKNQLKIRDQIVAGLIAKMAAPQTRDYFIAQGIAYSLNEYIYTTAEKARLWKEFSQFRITLQKENSAYNSALPEDAIKIREKILNTGIPGDPVVKRMWSLR